MSGLRENSKEQQQHSFGNNLAFILARHIAARLSGCCTSVRVYVILFS
jgi:hypothetical protein